MRALRSSSSCDALSAASLSAASSSPGHPHGSCETQRTLPPHADAESLQGLPAVWAQIGLRRLGAEPELPRVLRCEHTHAVLSRARARAFLSYLHLPILPFLLGDTASWGG